MTEPIVPPRPWDPPGPIQCVHCGAKLKGTKVCPKCGKKQVPVADFSVQQIAAGLEIPNNPSRLSMVAEIGDRALAKAVEAKRGLKPII